jgi:arylsulfatase A-like enzyme
LQTAHNFGGFEEIYNIPMIVWGASAGVAVGASTTARVGLHDLHPTLLELYGLLEGKLHRGDPKIARGPRSLTGNSYKSLRLDPDSGSTL